MSKLNVESSYFFGPKYSAKDSFEKKDNIPQQSIQAQPIELKNEKLLSPLEKDLNSLAQLISNLTESYTTAIFSFSPSTNTLDLAGLQTLSRDFVYTVKVPLNSSLIGWCASNKAKISVSPFDHDSSTLLYYTCDQGLKSFIAIPILDAKKNLLGVIACDSKKNYAFAKVTEKILEECSTHAARYFALHADLHEYKEVKTVDATALEQCFSNIRLAQSEEDLFKRATQISKDLVQREALAIITTPHNGNDGQIYLGKNTAQSIISHRLLETICQHKKILCAERSVHSKAASESLDNRSFLSVPFHSLHKEAGSFNLLSSPSSAFDAASIVALEEIAKVVSEKLEHLRLKKYYQTTSHQNGILNWESFLDAGKKILKQASDNSQSMTLVRISLRHLSALEKTIGLTAILEMQERLARIIDQAKSKTALNCSIMSGQILLLLETKDTSITLNRIDRLIERILFPEELKHAFPPQTDFRSLTKDIYSISFASSPQDGSTLQELTKKTLGRK